MSLNIWSPLKKVFFKLSNFVKTTFRLCINCPHGQICNAATLRLALAPTLAKLVKITVTGVFPGSPGPALQFVGVETIVGK
jgi:hypothetical protein